MTTPNTHRLQISAPNGHGSGAQVLIDGEPARALAGLTLTLTAEALTEATLHLVATPVEFDGRAKLTLLPETVDQLIALGWTPPA